MKRGCPALAVVVALGIVATACTSPEDEAAPDSTPSTTEATTTTTAPPPIVRGIGESLGLSVGLCYDTVPETTTTTAPPTTTTTVASSDPAGSDEASTTTTAPPTTSTAPPTTEPPAITTTIPRPPLVAVVECEGTHRAEVYATLCLGGAEIVDGIVDRPSELVAVGCPGPGDLDWPGDRALRRAAARECLLRFETTYGESYSASEIETTELVPTRGVWEQGDRRVVCARDA